MRTLFIGNSHTYYNDMPGIFKEICKENGIDMQVTMLTKGGMGLDYHADNEQTRFNILYGDYDFVILQHSLFLRKLFQYHFSDLVGISAAKSYDKVSLLSVFAYIVAYLLKVCVFSLVSPFG